MSSLAVEQKMLERQRLQLQLARDLQRALQMALGNTPKGVTITHGGGIDYNSPQALANRAKWEQKKLQRALLYQKAGIDPITGKKLTPEILAARERSMLSVQLAKLKLEAFHRKYQGLTDFQKRDASNLEARANRGLANVLYKTSNGGVNTSKYNLYVEKEHLDAQSTIKYTKGAATGITAAAGITALPAILGQGALSGLAEGASTAYNTIKGAKNLGTGIKVARRLKDAYDIGDSMLNSNDGFLTKNGFIKTFKHFGNGEIGQGLGSLGMDALNVLGATNFNPIKGVKWLGSSSKDAVNATMHSGLKGTAKSIFNSGFKNYLTNTSSKTAAKDLITDIGLGGIPGVFDGLPFLFIN